MKTLYSKNFYLALILIFAFMVIFSSSASGSSSNPIYSSFTATVKDRDTLSFDGAVTIEPRGNDEFKDLLGVSMLGYSPIRNEKITRVAYASPNRPYRRFENYKENIRISISTSNKLISKENKSEGHVFFLYYQLNSEAKITRLRIWFEFTLEIKNSNKVAYPFDKYDYPIFFFVPPPENREMKIIGDTEVQNDTISLTAGDGRTEKFVNVSENMEYKGKSYHLVEGFEELEDWGHVKFDIGYKTSQIQHMISLFPIDIVLILIWVIGFSSLLIRKTRTRDRINYITSVGTTGFVIFLTAFLNYNRTLPPEITVSVGHTLAVTSGLIFGIAFMMDLLGSKKESHLDWKLNIGYFILAYISAFSVINDFGSVSIKTLLFHIFISALPPAIVLYFLTR